MANASNSVVAALQPLVDSGHLVGAVTIVADKTKILQIDTVGYADRENKTPMTPDNVFWIASVTKPMTAIALMMLVDEGKVRPESPVEEYLPDYRGQMQIFEQTESRIVLGQPSHPITVHEVLNHTSGLPFMSRVEKVIDARPLREAAVSYAMTPLQSEPGTKYQYSNAGTNTAGRIIEVVSGQPYETFMQQRLFDPLGMSETTFFPSAVQLKRLAKTYRLNAEKTALTESTIDQFTYPLDCKDRYACPAGGLFSTAKDVTTFGQMILNGGTLNGRRYVSQDSLRRATSTQTGTLQSKDGDDSGYGYCFSTTRRDPGHGEAPLGACGHGGAYSNQLWIDPAAGKVLVFMVQHAGWVGEAGNLALPAFKTAGLAL